MEKIHISYSELKQWSNCPYSHKLSYIDKIKRNGGSVYTSMGKAVHKVCENLLKKTLLTSDISTALTNDFKIFLEEDKIILEQKEIEIYEKEMYKLCFEYEDALTKYFGEWEYYSAEESLYEKIFEEKEIKFKGFIDIVIKTKDGKYHIIDNKVCSWGWMAEKKSDALTTYQLTLYKKFFAQKHNIDEKDIETYFCLLKRTAKNDNIEIFRVTSGAKKTENALKVLTNCLTSIDKNFFPKNRLSCKYCEYYKKECT